MPDKATLSRWLFVALAVWTKQAFATEGLLPPLSPAALPPPHTAPSEPDPPRDTDRYGQLPPEPVSAIPRTGQLPPEPAPSVGNVPSLLGPPVAPLASNNLEKSTGIDRQRLDGDSHSRRSEEQIHSPSQTRTAALGQPQPSAELIPAQALERPPRPQPATSIDPVQEFLQQRSTLGQIPPAMDDDLPPPSTSRFGERAADILRHALGNTQELFKSDHVFDNFISPVINPFLLEDPRSLTEVRPLFMFQKVPRSQPDFRGGDIWFFGGQARVAFTDRISVVIHRLGGLSINTGSASIYDGSTGFSELWIGPKYTLLRDEQSGSLVAAGLQFQIPIGTRSVYQNTGTLSLTPYVSYAQNLDFGWRLGNLETLIGTGYSFSVTAHRSDYYYLTAQVDLDTFNSHRFYPLTGLSWQIYTANGKERPFLGADGRDLFNAGGLARGRGLLTWAIGARYKISEAAQLGGAFELPIAGPRDFFSYRFSVDFILRY